VAKDEFILDHILLYEGSKLFWRIKRTLDLRIFLCETINALVVRAHDSATHREFPIMLLDLPTVKSQIQEQEAARDAHRASLDTMGQRPKVPVEPRKEDSALKLRRLKKEAKRRLTLATMSVQEILRESGAKAKEQAATQLRSILDARQRIVSFVLARIEAEICSGEAGEKFVELKFMKRPTDSFDNIYIAEHPEGVEGVGKERKWNKKESMKKIRRTLADVKIQLDASNFELQRADEMQKAIEQAIIALKQRTERETFEALPEHKKIFVRAVRKALFNKYLSETEAILQDSPTFILLTAKQQQQIKLAAQQEQEKEEHDHSLGL